MGSCLQTKLEASATIVLKYHYYYQAIQNRMEQHQDIKSQFHQVNMGFMHGLQGNTNK